MSYDNGLSAYQRLREEPFELLLTDIVMPEMDGIELARRAAELDPDIKIMFITGFAAVALNSDSNAPKHAKGCRSRSICANWSTKCRRCSRHNNAFCGSRETLLEPSISIYAQLNCLHVEICERIRSRLADLQLKRV